MDDQEPVPERESTLIAGLRDFSNPTRRVERFLELCQLHASTHHDDDDRAPPHSKSTNAAEHDDENNSISEDRWAALDAALTDNVLAAVDSDIEAALFQRQKRKVRGVLVTPADEEDQVNESVKDSDRKLPDEVSRLRSLQKVKPWQLRPHQLARDLGMRAFQSHILRRLREIAQGLRNRHGQIVPWPEMVRATHSAARARVSAPETARGIIKTRELQIADVVTAEQQLIAAGYAQHTAKARTSRKRRARSLDLVDGDSVNSDEGVDDHDDQYNSNNDHDNHSGSRSGREKKATKSRKKRRTVDDAIGDTELLSEVDDHASNASPNDDDEMLSNAGKGDGGAESPAWVDTAVSDNGSDADVKEHHSSSQQNLDQPLHSIDRRRQAKARFRRMDFGLPQTAHMNAHTPRVARRRAPRSAEPESEADGDLEDWSVERGRGVDEMQGLNQDESSFALPAENQCSSPLLNYSGDSIPKVSLIEESPTRGTLLFSRSGTSRPQGEYQHTAMRAPGTLRPSISSLHASGDSSKAQHKSQTQSTAACRSLGPSGLSRMANIHAKLSQPVTDGQSTHSTSMTPLQPTSVDAGKSLTVKISSTLPFPKSGIARPSSAANQESTLSAPGLTASTLMFVSPDDISVCLRVESLPVPVSTDTTGQLATLQPGRWLSSSALASAIKSFNPDPATHRLMESPYLGLLPDHHAANDLKAQRDRRRAHSNFYILINARESHWLVAIIDRSSAQLEVYDPSFGVKSQFMPEYNAARTVVQEYALRVGQSAANPAAEWTVKPQHILAQRNSHDCGICVAVRVIFQMHGLACPPAIIPEVWRRAFALCLSAEEIIADDLVFSPSWVLDRLLQAYDLLPGTNLPPSTAVVMTYRKLSQSFMLLQKETLTIVGLYGATVDADSRMSIPAIQAALDWQQNNKDSCPPGMDLAYRQQKFASIDNEISSLRADMKSARCQDILSKDAATYERHAKEWGAKAKAMLDVVEENAMKEMEDIRSLRVAEVAIGA